MKKRISYAVIGLAGAVALVYYYFFLVSHGQFRIVAGEFTGMTYANMWEHLLHGRFDIDPSVNPEVFIRNGRFYVYHSFFAVLVRGLLTPFYDPSISIPRLTLLLAALELAVANLLIGVQLKLHQGRIRPFFYVFSALLLLGSPYLYIMAPAHCYHEAIMWAVANLTMFNFLFVRFAMSPSVNTTWRLCIMGMFAGFTLLSRPNVGFPPFLILGIIGLFLLFKNFRKGGRGILDDIPKLPFKQLTLIAAAWVFFGGCYLFVNYERMGNPFSVTPVILHPQYSNPAGVFNTRGYTFDKYGQWRLDRLPVAFEYYLVPHRDNFRDSWPYFKMGDTLTTRPFAKHIDYIEQGTYMPITLTAPLILLLCTLGIIYLARNWKRRYPTRHLLFGVATAANFWTWGFNFGFTGFNLRYSVDLMPAAVIGAYFGLYALKPMAEKWSPLKFRVGLAGFIFMAFFSFWTVAATYISYTMTSPYIPDADKQAFYLEYLDPFVKSFK